MKCVNCGKELIFRINLKDMSKFDGKAQCTRCKSQWKVSFEGLPEMTLQELFDASHFRELREAYARSLQNIGDSQT